MEITLEKIELVKDRTGVSYKEAKEALEAAGGSVVDAIIAIEETINEKGGRNIGEAGNAVIDKIKALIKKGNVSKIVVKKDDEVVLNMPVNIGILGTVLAPVPVIIGTVAAFGSKCVIEVVKDDGTILDVSEMATETFEDVKEKGSVFYDEVKKKSTEVYQDVKSKANDALDKVSTKMDIDLSEDDDFNCDTVSQEAEKETEKTENAENTPEESKDK